jgi:hypothetical protein
LGYERKRIAPTVIALKLVALETAGSRSKRQPTLLVDVLASVLGKPPQFSHVDSG